MMLSCCPTIETKLIRFRGVLIPHKVVDIKKQNKSRLSFQVVQFLWKNSTEENANCYLSLVLLLTS